MNTFIIIMTYLSVLFLSSSAYSSPPRSYWRFESNGTKTWGADSGPRGNNLTTTAASCHECYGLASQDGVVGSYLRVDGSSPTSILAAAAGSWKCGGTGCKGSTVELAIRAGRYFNFKGETSLITSVVAGQSVSHYEVRVGRHSLGFHTGSDPDFPNQDIPGWDVIANFEGTGITSPASLFDGQWHHLAFVQNGFGVADNCSVAVWLDGKRPSDLDFRGNVWWTSNASAAALRRKTCNLQITEPITFLSSPFDGDIDEVAIWEEPLSDAEIAAHAQDVLIHHRPYTLSKPKTPLPPAAAPKPTRGSFDIREFAKGTLLPTPPHTVTTGVNESCLKQLQAFPSPRYPVHATPRKLAPLSNCMDPRYMAGENQPNATKEGVEQAAIAIQALLSGKWNYALFIGNVNQAAFDHHATWFSKVLTFANENPDIPFEAEIIRANVRNDSLPRGPDNRMALANQHLPDSCYLQTRNGTYIDYHGKPVANATKHRYLRVTSAILQAKICPDSHFDSDGAYFATAFARMSQNLTAGRTLIRVWDDGEILAAQCESSAHVAYEMDPEMVADYDCCSNLDNVTVDGKPNQRDWRSYASRWRLRITQRFRDRFMRDRVARSLLGTAAYSEFEVEGSTAYFGRWPILREIMTPGGSAPVTKKTPRHATVDLYVTHPREWDIGAGSWHGLDWLSMVLPSQLASNDSIFTPFVSPGWNAAEEKNVRPAQFLGLLKMIAAAGAEWFYTGFFSPADDGQFARSQNWCWVAAMPPYAQAITQLWAELLGDGGTLLVGDTPMPRVMYNLPTDIPFSPISYRFWSGNFGGAAPVYIRQSTRDPRTLLVVGSVQPQSSAVGNMPLQLNVSIQLPPPASPAVLTVFQVRRQGSVYLVKIGSNGDVASVVQLDGWHEATHPSWWDAQTYVVEAELHDLYRPLANEGVGTATTETALASKTNFFSFTTFVTLWGDGKQQTLQYTLRPHCDTKTHCVCASLRTRARGATTCRLTGMAVDCVGVRGGGRGEFEWISVSGDALALTESSAVIRVRVTSGAVDFDSFEVTQCG